MIDKIAQVAEAAKETVEVMAEAAEKIKEVGKGAAENKIDITSRIDINRKYIGNESNQINIEKRIGKENGLLGDIGKELTQEQKTKLLDRGMSPGIINDCRYDKGIYKLKTTNYELAGKIHKETGVQYEKKVVDLKGLKVEGVFPKFESNFSVKLPEEKLLSTDKEQFDYCTEQLKKEIKVNPTLKSKFDERQLEQINSNKKPTGFTWHHNEETGKMELVDTEIHKNATHTGGRAIWGGGTPNRKVG